MDDDRIQTVMRRLFDYVKSPSLKHIRDPYSINSLAREIVKDLDRRRSFWQKWEGHREMLAKAAANCWIPVEDLRDYLNGLPGPVLTQTDVAQRLRAFNDEEYWSYPKPELQAGCLELYARERAAGTELPAIVGALQTYVEDEEQRLSAERDASLKQRREEDRKALEQRFMSGADCKWTPINRSAELYCRINGREFRIAPTKDKMWELLRIRSVEDQKGDHIGKYRYRGDANKVLAKLAYEPEPRW